MHTQIKTIIIFPCSIPTDDPSCTILSSDLSVARVLPPMSSVSESTASIRNPSISLIPSRPLSVSSFACSPIDLPRPDTLASALISGEERIFRLIKIGCTLPITRCTCERSVSTLRRLRNWLRSSMTCSSLALMNIHYAHQCSKLRHSGGDLFQDAPKKYRTIKSA